MWLELAKNRVLGNLDLGILIVVRRAEAGNFQIEHVRITEEKVESDVLYWGAAQRVLAAFQELAEHLDAESLLAEWEERGTDYAYAELQQFEGTLGPWLYLNDNELRNLESGARVMLGITEDGKRAVTYMAGKQNVIFRFLDTDQEGVDYMSILALLLGVSLAIADQETFTNRMEA